MIYTPSWVRAECMETMKNVLSIEQQPLGRKYSVYKQMETF